MSKRRARRAIIQEMTRILTAIHMNTQSVIVLIIGMTLIHKIVTIAVTVKSIQTA